MDIVLDPRLKEDSYLLGILDGSYLLLMRNALFPWYVLVPNTGEAEFHHLNRDMQMNILDQINLISDFIEKNNKIDKINVGAIGNIVSQLHIHVVGRRKDDVCWPGVVWGIKEFRHYQAEQVEEIKEKLIISFKNEFHAVEL